MSFPRSRRTPRGHPIAPSRRRKVIAWVGTTSAAALAAIAVAAATGLFGTVKREATEPKVPIQVTATVDQIDLSVVFPGLYTMPGDITIVPGETSGDQLEGFWRRWLAAGAAHYSRIGITVRMLNRGRGAIRVIGLEVVDLKRLPPLEGTLLHVPEQGGVDVFRIAFNLDEPKPIPREVNDDGKVLGNFFQRRELALGKGGRDTFWVPVLADRYSARFRLRLTYLAGDKSTPRQVTLNEGGRPFALTAPSCVNGKYRPYRRIYSTTSPLLTSSQRRMTLVPDPAVYWTSDPEFDPCRYDVAARIEQLVRASG